MAELSDIDKIRKKRRRKTLLWRILILVLLTLAGFGLYILKDEVNTVGITDSISDLVADFGRGAGYPLDFAGEQVLCTAQVGSNLAVLTDSNLCIYNGSGKKVRDIQHKYSNPVLRVGGKRILLYDRGGKRLRVESLARTVVQKEFEYPIYAGDISKTGGIAVATGAQRFTAQMLVYESATEETFVLRWQSPDRYITDLAFLQDGKGILAAGVTATGGDLLSSLHLFRLGQQEELFQRELKGELIHNIRAEKNGITVVTDHRTLLLSEDGTPQQEYDYAYRVLASYSHSEAFTALRFSDSRAAKTGNLVVLGKDGSVAWQSEISPHTQLAALSNSRFAMVLDGRLIYYDMAGKQMGQQTLTVEPLALQVIDESAYLVTPGTIEKFTLN